MTANPYLMLLQGLCERATHDRQWDEAEALLGFLVGAGGNDATLLYVLGYVRYMQGRYEESEVALRCSLAIDPSSATVQNDLAASLFRQGRDAEALTYIRQALTLEPGMPEAEETESLWLLRYGRFREGWPKYEARYRTGTGRALRRSLPQPQWMGEPIHGRTILLHAEQGLGDSIQFARYAPLVAARGARVILEVHPGLGHLFRTLPGVSQLIESGVPPPPFDLHCPLLSLPLAFGTDLDSIPASIPYVTADPARVFPWRQRLGPRKALRIGVAWSGNPLHREDASRSIPLAMLTDLLRDRPDREFHVVQTAIRPADRATLARMPHLREHGLLLKDFADTAALISMLDMVITVDTAVAHLAGAMGWPVWLLLPLVPDWRWMLGRDDSPWYPTMWLFRQKSRGDWGAVLADVAAQLDATLA